MHHCCTAEDQGLLHVIGSSPTLEVFAHTLKWQDESIAVDYNGCCGGCSLVNEAYLQVQDHSFTVPSLAVFKARLDGAVSNLVEGVPA